MDIVIGGKIGMEIKNFHRNLLIKKFFLHMFQFLSFFLMQMAIIDVFNVA